MSALTEGMALPLVASTGIIGTIAWNNRTSKIEKATLRLDIGHSPPECMDLNRLTLASP